MIGGSEEVTRRTLLLLADTPPSPPRPDRSTVRWERFVDPDGVLDLRTRQRKADLAMRRHARQMAKKSVASRSTKAAKRKK